MEVAFNKCLRKIWRLPFNTHTGILHCTAGVQSLFTVICRRSNSFSLKASCCHNRLVNVIFSDARHYCYTFVGHNWKYGEEYIKQYTEQDWICAEVIREIRSLPCQEQAVFNSMLMIIASS